MEGESRRDIGGGFRYKPSPPLSAIDRFLWGQNKSNVTTTTILQNNNQATPKQFCLPSTNYSSTYNNESSFPGFSSWASSTTTTSSRNQDVMNLVGEPDYLFFDDENCSSWLLNHTTNLVNPHCLLGTTDQEDRGDQTTVTKKGGKKNKVGCNNSSILIKGQWAEEEDRKLIKLVMQFGERKWAQIADKLDGRAGKQCRERWHNHLRPDIKKDGWTEEEERMLIEAHQIVGNRWAEIAKRIPGRTENSIKNHFNATKRRQNSRKKNKSRDLKEGGGAKSQTSILQDYIKSNSGSIVGNLVAPTANIATTHSNNPTDHQITIDQSESIVMGDSPPLIPHTSYDDELHFIQNLFATNPNNNHPAVNVVPSSFHVENNVNSSVSLNPSHLYSDTYLSYLLNGGSNINNSTSTTSNNNYSSSTNSNDYHYYDRSEYDDYMSLDLVQDYNNHQQKAEMDLIEMVSYNSHLSSSQGERVQRHHIQANKVTEEGSIAMQGLAIH